MMPLMKLATIFCRPKPMPTPTAPEKIASADRLMPTALSAMRREHHQRHPDHLDQQHLDRRRQVGGLGDPAFDEIAGDVGQPQRHDQQRAELDQQQRRQPQAAEHDRDRIRAHRSSARAGR
jgi:hypothetical protein